MAQGRKGGNPSLMRPGVSGNPNGRPKGAKNVLCLKKDELYELFGGSAKELVEKCIDMAMKGDMKAMSLCLERIVPKVSDTLQIEVTSFAFERDLMLAIKEAEKEY